MPADELSEVSHSGFERVPAWEARAGSLELTSSLNEDFIGPIDHDLADAWVFQVFPNRTKEGEDALLKDFAGDLRKALPSGKLHRLVCNAAVYLPTDPKPRFTDDGYEMSLQVCGRRAAYT